MDYNEVAEILFEKLREKTTTSFNDVLNEFNRGEVGVLSYLAFNKDYVLAGELSEKLNVTTARIASILNSLETKGLIKRKKNSIDKRKTLVTITLKGKSLATSIKQEIIDKIINIIKEVGYEEIKEYVRISMKIKEVLEKQ